METSNPLANLPMGFGMALAQDLGAMAHFSRLSADQQREIVNQTHNIHSKSEMKAFVHQLTGGRGAS